MMNQQLILYWCCTPVQFLAVSLSASSVTQPPS